MTTSPFKVGKYYKDKDGDILRVLLLDGPNPTYPLVAIDIEYDEIDQANEFTLEGAYFTNEPSNNDLILKEVEPPKRLPKLGEYHTKIKNGELFIGCSSFDLDDVDAFVETYIEMRKQP